MLKIIKSLVVIIAVAAIATLSTHAYFTDQKAVSGNTFTAGTLILTASPESAVWTMSNMAPGQSTGPQTLTVKNNGTLPGHLTLNIAFNPADGSPNPVNVTDENVAANLIVDSATWIDNSNLTPGLNLLSLVPDNNANGFKDLADLRTAVNGVGPIGTLVASEVGSLTMNVRFNPGVGNDYQSDGIEMVMTATLTSY